MKTLWCASTFLLMAACVDPGVATTPAVAAPGTGCVPVRLGSPERGVALADIGLRAAPGPAVLTVIASSATDASCRYTISAYDGGRIRLGTGETLRRDAQGAFGPAEARYRFDTNLPVTRLDNMPGGQFRFASPVGTWVQAGTTYTRYLGVWQIGKRNELRAFLGAGGSAVTRPVAILSSDHPIDAVGLSPLPDAPMGTIHLAHRTASGAVRLTALNWTFGSAFDLS